MQPQSALKQYSSNRDVTTAIIFLFRVKLSKYKGNVILNKLPSSHTKKKNHKRIPNILLHHMVNLTLFFALLEGDVLVGKHRPVQQHEEGTGKHFPQNLKVLLLNDS